MAVRGRSGMRKKKKSIDQKNRKRVRTILVYTVVFVTFLTLNKVHGPHLPVCLSHFNVRISLHKGQRPGSPSLEPSVVK